MLPSTTLYCKACAKHFPALLRTTKLAQSLRTTKLAQSTSHYYCVLENLHKSLPSTTSYYKACTKTLPSTTWYYKTCTRYVPVLLRIAKHAQITSQYYFVQQNLHKVLPSTILESWHKVSQYYFVLQGLHKVFPSTTSYYKACTKYVPILLPNTAQKKASRRMGFAASPIDTATAPKKPANRAKTR